MAGKTVPLKEMMALFWHGHFATNEDKVRDYQKTLKQLELFTMGTGEKDIREAARAFTGWCSACPLDRAHQSNEDFLTSCTPGYYNNEGSSADSGQQETPTRLIRSILAPLFETRVLKPVFVWLDSNQVRKTDRCSHQATHLLAQGAPCHRLTTR